MTWIDLSVLLQPRSRGFLSKKMERAGKDPDIGRSIHLSDWLLEM